MKKNIMSNPTIDMALIMDGVKFKACDFEDDGNIKMMVRRRHTTAEKQWADIKWRIRFTGKKHHKDRSREDYKNKTAYNNDRRAYNKSNKGGEMDKDNLGYVNDTAKNRRYNETVKDAMNDIYGKDDAEREANYFVSLVEAKESLEVYINRLELEYDEVAFMEHQFREWAMNTARTHHFEFRPIVKIDSYVSEALNNARASLAELEEDIDKLRKGVM